LRTKFYILLCILISLSIRINAQVFTGVYSNLLKHFQDTVISLTSANNSIISGIENKVVIRNSLFAGDVSILIDKKYILSSENKLFFLRAPALDSKENIALLICDFKKDTIFQRIFRNEKLPFPSIYIGHTNISETKKIFSTELNSADSVYIFFKHSLSGSSEWLKIKKFTIGYNYGSYYITHDNTGSIISQKIKSILLGLKSGQEISISIIAEGSGSITKEVPLLYFKIQ